MASLLRQESDDIGRRAIVPWLTALFSVAFVAIFLLEQHLNSMPQLRGTPPTTGTLLALGGLNLFLVLHGEAYRLLTAPFLHGSLTHLISNLVVFVLAGYRLEKLTGRSWMFCIFAGGALAGAGMSLALTAGAAVSVGASGGIMAMLAALFLVSFRLPPSRAKTWSQRWVVRLLIPAIIPLTPGASATHVDYGAHIGGAILGFLLGLLLALAWSEEDRLPPFRLGAAGVAIAACLSFASSAYAVALHYPVYEPLVHMIPESELPHGKAETSSRAWALLARYPHDPRAYVLTAEARAFAHDDLGAERDLRTALAMTNERTSLVVPALPAILHALLAETLLDQGRASEARDAAATACHATETAVLPAAMFKMLAVRGLC